MSVIALSLIIHQRFQNSFLPPLPLPHPFLPSFVRGKSDKSNRWCATIKNLRWVAQRSATQTMLRRGGEQGRDLLSCRVSSGPGSWAAPLFPRPWGSTADPICRKFPIAKILKTLCSRLAAVNYKQSKEYWLEETSVPVAMKSSS